MVFFITLRHDWTRRSWKVNGGEGDIWSYNGPIQERAS